MNPDRKKKIKRIIAREGLVIIGFLLFLNLFGCEQYPGGRLKLFSSDTEEVKNSVLLHFDFAGNTMGKVFDSWFDSPSWDYQPTYYKKGENTVDFTGIKKTTGQKVRLSWKCSFDKERNYRVCEYVGMDIDGKFGGYSGFESLMREIEKDLKQKTESKGNPVESNNPAYTQYYKTIIEKIRRYSYRNYKMSEQGKVVLSLILSSNGILKDVKVEEAKTESSKNLISLAINSVKKASPFPHFPDELNKYSELNFNVEISFESE